MIRPIRPFVDTDSSIIRDDYIKELADKLNEVIDALNNQETGTAINMAKEAWIDGTMTFNDAVSTARKAIDKRVSYLKECI